MRRNCIKILFLFCAINLRAQIGFEIGASHKIDHISYELNDDFNLGIQLRSFVKINLSKQIKIKNELTFSKNIHSNSGEIAGKKWVQRYIYNWISISSNMELFLVRNFYVIYGINYNYLMSNNYKWKWSDQASSSSLNLSELDFTSRTNTSANLGVGWIFDKKMILEIRCENKIADGNFKLEPIDLKQYIISLGVGIIL